MRDANATLASSVQPPTTASGRATILLLVNHCQIFVNVGEKLIVGANDLVLSADSPLYDLVLNGPSDFGGRTLGAFVAGVGEIDGPVDFRALGRTSRTWLSDVNAVLTKPLSWGMIGNTLLFLYPLLATMPVTVTMRYAQAPPFLSDETKTLSVPDYATGHLARLTSLVASIKMQQLTDFQARLQSLVQDMMGVTAVHGSGGKAD